MSDIGPDGICNECGEDASDGHCYSCEPDDGSDDAYEREMNGE